MDQRDTLVSLPVENDIHVSDTLYFEFASVPDCGCFATGWKGPQILQSSPIVRHVARRAAFGNPNIALNFARLHYKCTV